MYLSDQSGHGPLGDDLYIGNGTKGGNLRLLLDFHAVEPLLEGMHHDVNKIELALCHSRKRVRRRGERAAHASAELHVPELYPV